jgi:hypothetical protein
MPAIVGCTEHLHEWAHNRLSITLPTAAISEQEHRGIATLGANGNCPSNQPQIEVNLLAQVTAVVMAATQEAMANAKRQDAAVEATVSARVAMAANKIFSSSHTSPISPR